jgi:hypothetical protein
MQILQGHAEGPRDGWAVGIESNLHRPRHGSTLYQSLHATYGQSICMVGGVDPLPGRPADPPPAWLQSFKKKTGKKGSVKMSMDEQEEDKALITQAVKDKRVTRLAQQPTLVVNGVMRPYQIEGLNWMIRLHDNGINGILADEMGGACGPTA